MNRRRTEDHSPLWKTRSIRAEVQVAPDGIARRGEDGTVRRAEHHEPTSRPTTRAHGHLLIRRYDTFHALSETRAGVSFARATRRSGERSWAFRLHLRRAPWAKQILGWTTNRTCATWKSILKRRLRGDGAGDGDDALARLADIPART